jgi:CheY-like chemotaxis protein
MVENKRPIPIRPIILVVEDSAVLRNVAGLHLKRYNVDVDYAADGFEALDAVRQKPYSLILMDVNMPNMSGLEATRKIREIEDAREIPIVAVTASEIKENCLQAGMNDYVTKPADYHRIVQRWLPKVYEAGKKRLGQVAWPDETSL